ncbi:hypothetical protein HMPREF1210_02212 [Paenisporosarcina sp. HGH0030]|nr:hypothetical protein HMPREF1210_02212 [Paenisporosarcina sp. HGH0030]
MKNNPRKKEMVFKRHGQMDREIRDSILIEIILGILTFIPRLIIRVVRNLF